MNEATLPGDIPGLLRRGSPVVAERGDGQPSDEPLRGVVVGPYDGGWDVAWADYFPHPSGDISRGRSFPLGGMLFALDLSDPTGCAHAAWWALPQMPGGAPVDLGMVRQWAVYRTEYALLLDAAMGCEVDVGTLRAIVMRLAGMAP